jgi:hypothetical protein
MTPAMSRTGMHSLHPAAGAQNATPETKNPEGFWLFGVFQDR